MPLSVQIVTSKNTRVAVRCPRCSRVLVTGQPSGCFEVTCKLCTARVRVSDLSNPRPHPMASLSLEERGHAVT